MNASASDDLLIHGFGTVGYSADDSSSISAARDISQQPQQDFSTAPGWLIDSRLGLQVAYRATSSLDLISQFVVRDHFRADLNSVTELAYLSLRPDTQANIRVGRINYDSFLMSDHRNVGYAYTWVRPPMEFYGWIPIHSVNGADLAYKFQNNDLETLIKVQAGTSQLYIPIANGKDGGYQFSTDDLVTISVTQQSDLWRLKAAYSQFTIATEVGAFSELHQGLRSVAAANTPGVSAEASDLLSNLSFKGAKISYLTLGAAYDDGTWITQGEIGISTSTAATVPNARMAYLSVGRHVEKWTPFLLLSTSRPFNEVRIAANDWGSYNTSVRNPALTALNNTRIEQDTFSMGSRFDLSSNTSLKFQWEHTAIHTSGYGLWWVDANNRPSRVNLYSAALDFTF